MTGGIIYYIVGAKKEILSRDDPSRRKEEINLSRKLIIDGSAVYELDEECMLKRRTDEEGKDKEEKKENKQDSKEQ